MAKTTYGPATDLDFFKMYGVFYADNWKGMCLKVGSYVAAFGGYTVAQDGKVFCFIDIGSPIARTPILYRRARQFLNQMKQDGIREAFTVCDYSKPDAERFLFRLGFKPTDEIQNNFRMWAICLD